MSYLKSADNAPNIALILQTSASGNSRKYGEHVCLPARRTRVTYKLSAGRCKYLHVVRRAVEGQNLARQPLLSLLKKII